MADVKHTPGPWPYEYTGDGKRIVIGDGLVEGPRGYEVAEVYSDDCDPEEALANARLIAAAPALLEAAFKARDRLIKEGFLPGDPTVRALNAALALAQTGEG